VHEKFNIGEELKVSKTYKLTRPIWSKNVLIDSVKIRKFVLQPKDNKKWRHSMIFLIKRLRCTCGKE
jgi:hypothetical protein